MDSKPIGARASHHERRCSANIARYIEIFRQRPKQHVYFYSNCSFCWNLGLNLQALRHQNLFWYISFQFLNVNWIELLFNFVNDIEILHLYCWLFVLEHIFIIKILIWKKIYTDHLEENILSWISLICFHFLFKFSQHRRSELTVLVFSWGVILPFHIDL